MIQRRQTWLEIRQWAKDRKKKWRMRTQSSIRAGTRVTIKRSVFVSRVRNGIPIFNLIMRCESGESRRSVKLHRRRFRDHTKRQSPRPHTTTQRCIADYLHNELRSQFQHAGMHMHWIAVSCCVAVVIVFSCGRVTTM